MTIIPRAMTIAGSDSGGGAGIPGRPEGIRSPGRVRHVRHNKPSPPKNTLGVTDVMEIPPSLVESQIDAIVPDIGADAVKTGMLSQLGDHPGRRPKGEGTPPPQPRGRSSHGSQERRPPSSERTPWTRCGHCSSHWPPWLRRTYPRPRRSRVARCGDVDGAREAAKQIVAMGARAVVGQGRTPRRPRFRHLL